jgi:glucokinase-like ROK family protein
MKTTIKKATRHHTKNHNKRLILKTIYDQHQVSRADVARSTDLTRTTVSSTVTELMQEGLVEETGTGSSAGGKPPTLLRVVDGSRQLIGLDLANREFRGAVFDLRGQILHRASVPVDDQTGERALLALVYELIDQLLPLADSPLLGIGIGTPGVMDMRQGIIRKAVNLSWYDLPLRDLLAERYHLPVHIANDSQVAALAEYTFGAHQGSPNLIVLKVGRGTSAGIILNGQLYHGANSGASEIGHVRVVDGGEPCPCGNFGCLETVASSRAIIRQARTIAQADPNSLLHHFAPTLDAITTDTILQAFEAGDENLRQIIIRVGRYLGLAVANLIGALNIQQIVISGSLARFGETLLEPIKQEMQTRASALIIPENQVTLSSLGQDVVITGAAALLLSQELEVV